MSPALALAAALLVLAAPAAAEELCVTLDEKNDTLSEDDRRGALAVARAAFVKAGATVVDPPCANPYVITNSKLGQTIFVTMSGPKGQRDAKASKVDELGDLYQQMAKSLVDGIPMGDAVGRNNVTSRQQNPKRQTADSIFWFGLGGAYMLGLEPNYMPVHFGGGWRYEVDQLGLEVSASASLAGRSDRDEPTRDESLVAGSLALAGYWFADEEANNTAYFGGGVGFGGGRTESDYEAWQGVGLQATASGGFEFLRATVMRAFVQIDVVVPMYEMEREEVPGSRFSPMFVVKVGGGWNARFGGFRAW